jgi:hypothetical protein
MAKFPRICSCLVVFVVWFRMIETTAHLPIAKLTSISKTIALPFWRRLTLPPGSRPERALHNVSLEILPGKIYAACGVSGSGKSFLLKIISSQLEPSNGTVSILQDCRTKMYTDYDFERLGDEILSAGSLAGALTRLFGQPSSKDLMFTEFRSYKLFSDLVTPYELELPWGQLSTSSRAAVRCVLALARCAGSCPSPPPPLLLLFDEVMDGFGSSKWACSESHLAADRVLRRAAETLGSSIVYSTHSAHHARCADLVIFMSGGEIRQINEPNRSIYLEWVSSRK